MPAFFKGDKVFEKLLWEAASANLTAREMWDYQMNLKQLRDAEAQLWAKYDDGVIDGTRRFLKMTIQKKFGALPESVTKKISDLNDLERLRSLIARVVASNDLPNELQEC